MFTFNSFLLCAIFFCTFRPGVQDMALDIAEKYFNSENYYDSVTEYKRYIFFNSEKSDDSISHAHYKIGLAYRNLGKWDKSLNALRKSVQTANSDYIRDERKIDLAVVLIARGNYSAAEFYLIKLEMFSNFLDLKQKAAFFRGVSAVYSFKWKQARDAFQIYFNNHPDRKYAELGKRLDFLLDKAQNLKYKSPKLAKVLSIILPGSGQVYSGDYRNGINALAINIATGYLLVNDLVKRRYFDAIFNSFFLFEKFYSGNRYHAAELAKRYNQELNQRFAAHLLEAMKEEIK